MLTENELLRYKRQIGIDSWGNTAQEKVKNARVFVAGAGGLGGALLFYLTAAGVGKITICDCDKVEITNLNRQILHGDSRIGSYKADSAFETLHNFNPDVSINRVYDKITAANAGMLTDGHDLIIDCLDNFKTRKILNQVAVKRKKPFIHAGVAGFQGQITFIHHPETPCLACFMPFKDNKGPIYIAGATAGVMGSLLAVEAIKYITGIGENLKNKVMFWDGLTMRFETIKLSKNPACTICGKSARKY